METQTLEKNRISADPNIGSTNGTARNNMRIRGDHVQAAVQDLPEEQRIALKWFSGYIHARNLTNKQVGMLLKKPGKNDYYSYASIYHALTGRRAEAGVSMDSIVGSIEAFRRVAEEREMQVDSGFVETRLFHMISDRNRRALLRRRITWIFGDSQIGKSECLKEYQRRNNHGETIYVEVPEGCSLTLFLRELCKALNIPVSGSRGELRDAIFRAVDDRMLIIFDEGHRNFTSNMKRGLEVLGFIRELWNRRQCGMCICMTNEGRDIVKTGKYKKALEQLWRRRLQPLQLPDVPFSDDLDRFSAAFGLPPATDEAIKIQSRVLDRSGKEQLRDYQDNPLRLQEAVCRKDGLGVWLTLLRDASDLAREAKRDITWGAVLKAHCVDEAQGEVAA